MRIKLNKLEIKGFKSIDSNGQTIPFGDITVLIGANGSGKSNVISFLRMLQSMATGKLSDYLGREHPNRLLYYGSKKTAGIQFKAFFDDGADIRYEVDLKRELPWGMYIGSEKVGFGQFDPAHKKNWKPKTHKGNDGSNEISEFHYLQRQANGEAGLLTDDSEIGRLVKDFLAGIEIFQFNDTSDSARIKDMSYIDDAYKLKHDAGNLAPFLRMLKNSPAYEKYYRRIILFIRSVMPQFDDFALEPLPGDKNYIHLNWKDKYDTGFIFDPYQLSDGSLRFMALATLLLQPPELLPTLIAIDEPELGLHPTAITALTGMIKIAAQNTQILMATQSPRFLDELDVEDIVIVEHDKLRQASIFSKLDEHDLADWLESYCLSELWEKNVLGGLP